MADAPGNSLDGTIGRSVAPTEDELDIVLDAAQQAWERGETLLLWVDRYPTYALQLGELALSLARQQLAPAPTTEDSAAAKMSFLQAMDGATT